MKAMNLQDKNILIYGTGENAKKTVVWAKQQGINIVGALDRFKMTGEVLGIPIVLWDDVGEGEVDAILIAAQHIFYREIYGRILPYCQRRRIKILGMYGQDLSSFFGNYQYIDAFARRYIDRQSLINEIAGYDIVSFDVFDTVLMRQVYEPTDIFDIVEKRANNLGIQLNKFKRIRREAELRSGGANIHVIYDILQEMLGLSDEEKKLLLDFEIKAEFEFVTARKDISVIINDLKRIGKTVIYVSDMYLPKEIIKNLLVMNGCYEGDDIYVSCDFGTGKSGELFGYVAEKYDVRKCIHIGDDLNADVMSPKKYGIKGAGIYKAADMFFIAGLGDLVGYMDNIADKIYIGGIINSLFNSPFAFEDKYGVAKIDTIEKLVDMFLVPVAVEYAKGLEECIGEYDLDGLLFASRDGYFFKQLYEKLADKGLIKRLPDYYILVSRILAMRVGAENESDVNKVFNNNMPKENKNGETPKWEKETVDSNRNNYKLYLKKCGIDLSKSYLLCEFDGRGTVQYYVGRIFEGRLKGLYFLSILTENPYEIEKTFVHSIIYEKEYSLLYRNIPFLECVFSSPEKSVCGINDDLSFEYKKETRSKKDITFMLDVQNLLLRKSVEFIEKLSEYGCTINSRLVEIIFNKFTYMNFVGQAEHVKDIVLLDELTGVVYDINFRGVHSISRGAQPGRT